MANSYEGVIAKLIRRFKFSHVKAAARPLAHNLANSLPYLAPDTLLVPIPTVINHVRMRGYDHALLLAKELGHLTGLQCKSLLRRNNKLRQVGQGRKQRKIQAKSAFYTSPRLDCRGAHILLIDDVITTGATLEAAAAELYRIGAKQVDAVVVAKQALKL
ncbi:MAG TPA: phosphoribosyltransferase family protein [Patescibacteria group bacterium]|nr:phosphoribosyltransferase family protein [Patescibacteria group bacterium]